MADIENNTAAEIREIMETYAQPVDIAPPDQFDLTRPVVIGLPEGMRPHDLTSTFRNALEHLKPARRKGTARLKTAQSLIDWINRFKGENSVIYADPDRARPTCTAIADYHFSGVPQNSPEFGDETARHGDHRATYAFPLSREWETWSGIAGAWLAKDQLCEFIEANAKDLINPSPALLTHDTPPDDLAPWEAKNIEIRDKLQGRFGDARSLINMGRQFDIRESSALEVTTNPDTGETAVKFNEEHTDQGGRPLKIATLFLIAIPVFDAGDVFRLTVRFAYRKRGADLKFSLSIYDRDAAIDTAFAETVEQIHAQTELPVFFGAPES